MQLIQYIIIFGLLFIQTEMKPIDSRLLKLPIPIENGMNIILEGLISNEHEQLNVKFAGENLSAEDEYKIKYIPKNQSIYLCHGSKEKVILKGKTLSYPSPFVLQFNARTFEQDNNDKYLIEIYFEGMGNVRQTVKEFIILPSFTSVDYIVVDGFSNVHNLTFSFDRE